MLPLKAKEGLVTVGQGKQPQNNYRYFNSRNTLHWVCFAILILSNESPKAPQTCRGSIPLQGQWAQPGFGCLGAEQGLAWLLSFNSLCAALPRSAASRHFTGTSLSSHGRVQSCSAHPCPTQGWTSIPKTPKICFTASKAGNPSWVKSLILNQSINPQDC